MISVAEALDEIFALVAPVDTETVPLTQAAGRMLAAPVTATRAQPPFDSSAMDGYALRSAEVQTGATFTVIGEAAAGLGHAGSVGPGQAVRIFTGAPVPNGADHVVIQEDTARQDDQITLLDTLGTGANIRPAGGDFGPGDQISAPHVLTPGDLALAAAMNAPNLTVRRKPIIALLATGDELVMPGEAPGPDQIIASNSFGLKALFEAEGAHIRLLPIARDTHESLSMAFELAEGADLLITIGGASVGDYDLVGPVAAELGMKQSFYKVAMRPGKPLMAGKLGDMAVVGLPGNSVSAIVCGHVFIRPAIRAMLGLPAAAMPLITAELSTDLPANGPRAHYMRARLEGGQIRPFDNQDSSLLSVYCQSNALLIRPVADGPRRAGEIVQALAL